MKVVTVECRIEGLVPAMHHRFPLPEKPGDKRRKARQTVDDKCYMDEKGVFLPADSLRMMLIGNRFRPGAATILGNFMESRKGKSYRSFCAGCVWVKGPQDPLKVYYEPQRKTYDDVDIRSFVNATGGRDVEERPLVTRPWTLSFIVEITGGELTSDKVRELFEVAGLRCGAGAYGPTFGRFQVTEWKIIAA